MPADEQAELLEVVRRRLAEQGRRRILEDIRQGRAQFSNGTAKPAGMDKIMIMRETET